MEALLVLSFLLYNKYVQHDIMCVARTDKRENRPKGMVHVTSPEDTRLATATRQLRGAIAGQLTPQQAELVRRRLLLHSVPMLNQEDAIRVLQGDTEGALVLIDPDTGVIKVPTFPFLDEDGQISRDLEGVPKVNPSVLEVYRYTAFTSPNKMAPNIAWNMFIWWATPLNLDVRDPESRVFRPIDVVRDSRMLYELVDWLKDLRDESYG